MHFITQRTFEFSVSHSSCDAAVLSAIAYHIYLNKLTIVRTTAGQEDPFELDSNLLLSSGRHGEDRKRQYIHLYDHETPLLDDLADLLY